MGFHKATLVTGYVWVSCVGKSTISGVIVTGIMSSDIMESFKIGESLTKIANNLAAFYGEHKVAA